MNSKPISPDQVKMIHALKGALRLDDENYRDLLSGYKVNSSKLLSFENAKDLISRLEIAAVQSGAWEKRPSAPPPSLKWDNLGVRPGMATPAQLRKIEAMWSNVSRQPTAETRRTALNHFLETRFGVSRIEWLEMNVVGKIITALEAMQNQKQKESGDEHNVQQSHSKLA